MELTLDVKNGKYYVSIFSKEEDNTKEARIRNQKTIEKTILSIDQHATNVIQLNRKLVIHYEDFIIILKDYKKNKSLYLYRFIMNTIPLKLRLSKINYLNMKRIFKMSGFAITYGISLVAITNLISSSKPKTDKSIESKFEINEVNNDFNTEEFETLLLNQNDASFETVINPKNEKIEKESIDYEVIQMDEEKSFNEQLNECLERNLNGQCLYVSSKIDNFTSNKLLDFYNNGTFKYYEKYGEEFGIDPYLMLALSLNETSLEHEKTLPGGELYNGYAVGIMQHEKPDELSRVIEAYNFKTNQVEQMELNMENALDLENNIKMGFMLFQSLMFKYENPYIALQAYNYGESTMDMLINLCSYDNGLSYDEVINGNKIWDYVIDLHNNPKTYLPKWQYKTYGNSKYVDSVLGYYMKDSIQMTKKDGTTYNFNLTDELSLNITK